MNNSHAFIVIDAFAKLPSEELDAHDGKDEPEDQANQYHVANTGNGIHQSVDHDLIEDR